MDLVTNVLVEAIVLTLGIGIVIWQIKGLTKKVDKIIESEHECRESLPFKFALKDSLDELWAKTSKMEADLKYLQGRTNGKS